MTDDHMRSGNQPSHPSGAANGDTSNTFLNVEGVKQTSMRMADEARQYADDIASRAKDKGRSMFEQQKDMAVGQLDTVAHALRSSADQLHGDGKQQVARYIDMAADQLESFGSRFREKDLDTLIDDTQNLARRSPGAFLAVTVAAGFLLTRFLKSSSERRRESTQLSTDRTLPVPVTKPYKQPVLDEPAGTGLSGSTIAPQDDPIRSAYSGASAVNTGSTPQTGATTAAGTASPSSNRSNPGDDFYGNR